MSEASGYIYLAKSNYGLYKYGCTKSPKRRIKQLRRGCPFPLYKDEDFHFICTIPARKMYQSENLFKWFILDNHIPTGEYFPIIEDDGTPHEYLTEEILVDKLKECAEKF